jgi:hypothetical protein
MALFNQKSEEELVAEAAAAAEKAFWASPQGRATKAFDRGDEFLQIEIPHSSVTGFTNAAFNSATAGKIRQKLTRTDLLGQIEEAGWRLEHANWVYIQTGQNSRDKFLASGQHVVVTGEVVGIYLFRRDETRANRPEPPSAKKQPSKPNGADGEKSTNVRCHKCQHVQRVPVTQSSFVCAQCKTNLKRRAEAVSDQKM